MQNNVPVVLSFGGGVQSMALLVLAARREIKVDWALFADVGEDSENPATLEYFHSVAVPYAVRHGVRLEVVRKVTRSGEAVTLLDKVLSSERSIPIPVRMSNGAPGNRTCTAEWKIRVVDKWIAARYRRRRVDVALGISLDEVERARFGGYVSAHGRRGFGYEKRMVYPLIERRVDRAACLALVAAEGLPEPPKSACWFCPFRSAGGWEAQRVDVETFQKSLLLEAVVNRKRRALGRDDAYLHPRAIALSSLVGTPVQLSLFDEPSDMCAGSSCMT